MTENRCDYCWRPGIATIYLRRGLVRRVLRQARRMRTVCADHLLAKTRPAGRRG